MSIKTFLGHIDSLTELNRYSLFWKLTFTLKQAGFTMFTLLFDHLAPV